MRGQSLGLRAYKRRDPSPSHHWYKTMQKMRGLVILILYFSPMILYISLMPINVDRRRISIDYGDGRCQWTNSHPLPADSDPYGTLLASYPASGMRVMWQQIEGLTSIRVGDDYQFGGDKVGIIKTQYPHYEGIWSYGSTLDQV
eukprot:CAMPEP_0194147334 /NCGR_PEP_ID=MMETSP0152-20130528/23568_1 /TAXON_ID=1049557 /ORGANISM="Thalassiothrix antarctica, Strain L6-D1" /LENGTH=143 /DNA_ID=CAMNT_0038848107 /DNA_START=71 /DNA_END=498 /DNA_ORIENTATION=+